MQIRVFVFELTAADRTTDEEVELSFTVRAFDDQGDAITYSIDQASLDEAMTIETVDDTTGVFRWTPDEMDGPGEFEVTVTATDDNAIPAFRDTTITVIVNEVNLPPELAAIGNQQGLVGQTLDFTAEASDPDFPANTLTFTLADTTVSGMAIDPASGAFTWTPLVSDTVQATVVVTDGGGLFDSETIELLIRAADDTTNTPPRFDFELTAADRTTDEEVELSFEVKAFDDQGDAITYSIDQASLDEGMTMTTVEDTIGVFVWTPDEMDGPGEFEVTVTATDNNATPASRDTTITVSVNEVNLPPVLNVDEIYSGSLNTPLTFMADATDPDIPVNNLEYSLVGALEGMEIDAESGAFSWTPEAAGTFAVTVVVTDNGQPAASDSAVVNIIVVPPPFCGTVLNFPINVAPGVADAYIFELDTDSLFSSPIVIRTDISAGTETAVVQAQLDTLRTDTEYFWRVFTELNGMRIGTSITQKFLLWPSTIQVQHSQTFPAIPVMNDFRMVSVPGQSEQISIPSTFPGQTPEVDWRVFRDNSADVSYPSYLEQMDPNASDANFTFQPGRGFWAISNSSWEVPSSEIPSATLDPQTSSFFGIPLNTGASESEARWTMIGNPFDYPVAWQEILDANGITTDDDLWDWTGDGYVSAEVMEPYKGYYFFNRGNLSSLNLSCFLEEPTGTSSEVDEPSDQVTLRLSLQANPSREAQVISEIEVGWAEDADEALDAKDRFIPPAFFEPYRITLVNDELQTRYPFLQKEVRPSALEPQAFEIELKSEPGEVSYLHAEGLEQLMSREVYLFDLAMGRSYNLHEQSVVLLEPDKERSRYRLLVGDEGFIASEQEKLIPDGFRVAQGYPNPFVEQTVIEYALPELNNVQLEIYNMLGQRVKTLVAQEQAAGFHQVIWDGTNDAGESVASGVYIYVFQSDGYQEAKRLVRVR